MTGREVFPDEELRRRIMDFIMAAGQTLLETAPRCSGWSRPWRSWPGRSICGSSTFMC